VEFRARARAKVWVGEHREQQQRQQREQQRALPLEPVANACKVGLHSAQQRPELLLSHVPLGALRQVHLPRSGGVGRGRAGSGGVGWDQEGSGGS